MSDVKITAYNVKTKEKGVEMFETGDHVTGSACGFHLGKQLV